MLNSKNILVVAGLIFGAIFVLQPEKQASATVDGFQISAVANQVEGVSHPGVWIVNREGKLRYCQISSTGVGVAKPGCTDWN